MAAGQPFDYVATIWSFGERATIPAGTTRHLAAFGGANQTLPNEVGVVVLHAGRLRNLTWRCQSNTLTGVKNTITVYINGISSGMATGCPPGTTSGGAVKGDIPVKQGDFVSMRIQTASGGGTIARPQASVELLVASTIRWWSSGADMLSVGGGKVGIGTDTPAEALSVQGTIESIAGGFKFPDGSVQTTAAAAPTPGMPPGSVIAYAGESPPAGWLLCDGSWQDPLAFPGLFDAIAFAHGKEETTGFFALPDYRGKFLRGVSGTSGADPDASSRGPMGFAGGNTGNAVGSVQPAETASHQHSVGEGVGDSTTMVIGGGTTNRLASFATDMWNGPGQLWTGHRGGNETRPVNAYVNFLIKT